MAGLLKPYTQELNLLTTNDNYSNFGCMLSVSTINFEHKLTERQERRWLSVMCCHPLGDWVTVGT